MRVLALLLLTASVATAQTSATYEVTFTSTWSAATHPEDFPSNPHYSPLIGASHDADVSLWKPGETATPGVESMAETGGTTALRAEIEAHANAGRVARVLSGSGISLSPGSVTMSLAVDDDAPLVTLVSMLAPSPDWFVGVAGLDLREGGEWVAERTVDLYVYDAGTDDGAAYTSPNDDSDPKQPIARIEAAPFLINGSPAPVGTFRFRRAGGTATPSGPETRIIEVVPNPATGTSVRLRLGGTARRADVRVFDALGREVFAASVDVPAVGTEVGVPTAGWAAGVYTARVASAGDVEVRRLTVIR